MDLQHGQQWGSFLQKVAPPWRPRSTSRKAYIRDVNLLRVHGHDGLICSASPVAQWVFKCRFHDSSRSRCSPISSCLTMIPRALADVQHQPGIRKSRTLSHIKHNLKIFSESLHNGETCDKPRSAAFPYLVPIWAFQFLQYII